MLTFLASLCFYCLQNILLVQRQMSVKERDVEQFHQAFKIYTEATASQLNNLQYVLFVSLLFLFPVSFNVFASGSLQVFQIAAVSPDVPLITPTALFFFPPSDPSVFIVRSVSVQNLPDRSCFIMYEFWQDRLSWMRYALSLSLARLLHVVTAEQHAWRFAPALSQRVPRTQSYFQTLFEVH